MRWTTDCSEIFFYFWDMFRASLLMASTKFASEEMLSPMRAPVWKRATLQPLINEGNRESDTAHTVQSCTDSLNQFERKSKGNSHPSKLLVSSYYSYRFIFSVWIYTIINIHPPLYMCHAVAPPRSRFHTCMIYLKKKYCFSNIASEDLLFCVTIVITIAFKIFTLSLSLFFLNDMGIQHLVRSGFIQDHTSFFENPYIQNQRRKSATPSILGSHGSHAAPN